MGLSKAPMSTVPLTIRGKPAPRWSVVKEYALATVVLPWSIAGLPGKRAMVWVGPPLLANPAASPGLATPTKLPFAIGQAASAPMPIRLFVLAGETCPPAMSWMLKATIVL